MAATDAVFDSQIETFRKHLREVEATFNSVSRKIGLGVLVSADYAASDAHLRNAGFNAVLEYSGDGSGEGELHPEQIETVAEAIGCILNDPKARKTGLIQGAMQSGKTTTSLALNFAGPVYYLRTGQPLYPVYLLTVHTSQAKQTGTEFGRFLHFYSELRFVIDQKAAKPKAEVSSEFAFQPSLRIYRDRVLRRAFDDLMSASASPEEFIERRTRGKAIVKIAERIEQIVRQNFRPLMILDEPQFGIMDRVTTEPNGEFKPQVKPTVMRQIFEEIESRLQIGREQHTLIALSATPYEMYDMDTIWVVHQRLGKTYRGFNFIAGDKIDKRHMIIPPVVLSLSEFAQKCGISALARVNIAAVDRESRFLQIRAKLGIDDDVDHAQYFRDSVAALKAALLKLIEHEGNPHFGVCIRAKNQNAFARSLEYEMKIETQFEVIQFNGAEAKDRSVKELVNSRKHPELPYLMFVTNRARMGDAFPRSAKYFIEMSERFSDMNAMFQGLLGRACGYGKDSTVILSDNNAMLVKDIVSVDGRYLYKPSQGSVIIGEVRRGHPITLLEVKRDPSDAKLESYFARVERFAERRLVNVVDTKLRSRRSTATDESTRYAPLLTDARHLRIFEHIETDAFRSAIYPGLPPFRILRPGEHVQSGSAVDEPLTYALAPDGSGGCRVTLREQADSAKTGGVRARGTMGGGDARTDQQIHLEPQIVLHKVHPVTGDVIADRGFKKRVPGRWRVSSVLLPLKVPVRPLVAGDGTLPRNLTAVDPLLNAEQRAIRDREEHRQRGAGKARRITR